MKVIGEGQERLLTNPYPDDARAFRNPGYSFDDAQENCGSELLTADNIVVTAKLPKHEREVLRSEVDPYRHVIRRG